ncbi:MAG: NAD-dependent succinate-semialdehyde dehydrogenase [Phycisphaeraceae bacterium]|nr:NAD-dependent succinate-semialdehyde dehydrogenase [Phycisphaeraceae bacterium]
MPTPQSLCLINNHFVPADSGNTFPVTDPATDKAIASVPDCGSAETWRAIEAAAAALPEWRTRPAPARARVLRTMGDLMLRDQDRLAAIMTAEQGKPLAEARGEIAYAASFLFFSAGEAERVYGQTVPASASDKRILVLKQPVGVAAAITPWNFPSAMITRKLGPALAAGCTIVIKPAEATPLSAFAIGEIAIEAGVPAGVVNIITGDPATIGREIFRHDAVRKVSFTGSTEVGKILMDQAANRIVKLSLELGGHAPFIVFDDADLDKAVAGLMANKFRNAGQTCICSNRVFVHERVFAEFAQRLRAQVAALKVGPGTHDGVQIGPLIDDAAVEKVASHVANAKSKGAKVTVGGDLVKVPDHANRFFAPTLIEDANPEMKCFSEETFGPVVPMMKFSTEREAIDLANDTPFGLAAYFYTSNASRLIRIAEALDYGVVGANDAAPSTAQAPFGGTKESGLGREGGHWGVEEYLETKYVSWGV